MWPDRVPNSGTLAPESDALHSPVLRREIKVEVVE